MCALRVLIVCIIARIMQLFTLWLSPSSLLCGDDAGDWKEEAPGEHCSPGASVLPNLVRDWLRDGELAPHTELVVGGHVAKEHVLTCVEAQGKLVRAVCGQVSLKQAAKNSADSVDHVAALRD